MYIKIWFITQLEELPTIICKWIFRVAGRSFSWGCVNAVNQPWKIPKKFSVEHIADSIGFFTPRVVTRNMFGIWVSCPQPGRSGATAHGWMLAGNSARRVCSSGLGPDHPMMWPSPRCYRTMRWKVGFGNLRMGMLMQLVFFRGGVEPRMRWNIYTYICIIYKWLIIYYILFGNLIGYDWIGLGEICAASVPQTIHMGSQLKGWCRLRTAWPMPMLYCITYWACVLFTGMSLVLLMHLRDQCPYTCTLDTCL